MCSTAPSCAIATAAPRAWRAAVTVATQAGRTSPSLPHNGERASRVALAPHPTPPRRPRCPHLPRATSRATHSDVHAAARFCRPIRWASPVRANKCTKRRGDYAGRSGATRTTVDVPGAQNAWNEALHGTVAVTAGHSSDPGHWISRMRPPRRRTLDYATLGASSQVEARK